MLSFECIQNIIFFFKFLSCQKFGPGVKCCPQLTMEQWFRCFRSILGLLLPGIFEVKASTIASLRQLRNRYFNEVLRKSADEIYFTLILFCRTKSLVKTLAGCNSITLKKNTFIIYKMKIMFVKQLFFFSSFLAFFNF